jgi:hypothetical protein
MDLESNDRSITMRRDRIARDQSKRMNVLTF